MSLIALLWSRPQKMGEIFNLFKYFYCYTRTLNLKRGKCLSWGHIAKKLTCEASCAGLRLVMGSWINTKPVASPVKLENSIDFIELWELKDEYKATATLPFYHQHYGTALTSVMMHGHLAATSYRRLFDFIKGTCAL